MLGYFHTRHRHRISKLKTRRRRLIGLQTLEPRHLLAVTFEFNFLGNENFGFSDPNLGLARREALVDTANNFGQLFNDSAEIEVDVFNTIGEQQGAFVSAVFDDDGSPAAGFFPPIVQQKILGGVDGNGSESDGELTVVWELIDGGGFDFGLGDDVIDGEIDFQAVITHELTHLVGITSDILADGSSVVDAQVGIPTLWTPYDQFLADANGQRIIDPQTFVIDSSSWAQASVNDALFFTGANAVAANGGNPVAIHSPNDFAEGSSTIHLRIDPPNVSDATHLLLPEVRDGKIARRLHPVTVGILTDLGYDFAQPDSEIVVTQSGQSTSLPVEDAIDTFDVSLSVRPPTDVTVQVVSSDEDLVSVTSATTLTFTPVNWNVPQTVTLQAGGVLVETQPVEVFVDPSSDPLYVTTFDVPPAIVDVTGDDSSPGLDSLVASGGGSVSVIGSDVASFAPFDGFTGEVRVASADFNGDGTPDIVVGTGPGVVSRVRVVDGTDGSTVLRDLVPFPGFSGGVFVAAGDVTGDGKVDLIVSPDAGAGPTISVFDGLDDAQNEPVLMFFAFDIGFAGGVRVAVGDVTGDGIAEIIAGAGPGGGPSVRAFAFADPANPVRDFFAFDPTFDGGIHVATGDVNGDTVADIVVGADAGGGPHVRAFDGSDPTLTLADFFSHPVDFSGGIRVATNDLNDDGKSELVAGPGPGSVLPVSAFNVADGVEAFADEFPFGQSFTGGFFVAGSVPTPPKPVVEIAETSAGGDALTVTIAFSEDVTDFTSDDITINSDAAITLQTVDARTYTFDIELVDETSLIVDVAAGAAMDLEGTPSLAADSIEFALDGTPPTATITSTLTGPTNAETIPVEIVFSEDALGLLESEVDVSGGTVSEFDATSSGATFTVTPTGDGEVRVSVPAESFEDIAGNVNADDAVFEILSDRTAPTATITSTLTGPTNAETIPVEIVFSEEVFGLLESELDVSGGTISEFDATPSGVTFTVTPTGDGEVRVSVPAESFDDIAGNVNADDAVFEMLSDRTAPTATISSTLTGPTSANSIPITLMFSESVEEIGFSDLTVTGGTPSGLVRDGDLVYTFNVTPTSELVSIRLEENEASDPAGNGNASAEFSITVIPDFEIDLALSLTATPDDPLAGGVVAYVLSVENEGPEIAPMVEFTGTFPSELSFLQLSSSSDCLVDGETLACSFGDVPLGETVTRVVSFVSDPTTTAGTSIVLLGSVESLSDDVTESDLADNDATVTSTIATAAADLSVRVTSRAAAFRVGQQVILGIEVHNNGPSPATGVEIQQVLPSSVTFSNRSDSRATFADSTVTIPIGNLGSGRSTSVTVIGAMTEAGVFTATTTVSSGTADPNSDNDSIETELNVRPLGSPLAVDDAFIAQVDTGLPITPTGLLSNDQGAILLSELSDPVNGSIIYSDARNAFVYTPDLGFVGTDTLAYSIQSPLQTFQTLGITDAEGNAVQIEIDAANVGFSSDSSGIVDVSKFSISVDRNNASSAILSSLANGSVLPVVTISTRRGGSDGAATQEVVRWTLTDARITSFSTTDNEPGEATDFYRIAFEKIELDASPARPNDAPESIGPRVHVGIDLNELQSFKSSPFTSLDAGFRNDRSTKVLLDNRVPGSYVEINGDATTIDIASMSIVNNSQFNTREPQADSGVLSIQIQDDVDGANFIESLFRRAVIDEIVLTEITLGPSSAVDEQGSARVVLERTLKNVRVESVSTSIGDVDQLGESNYFVSLRYQEIDTRDQRFNASSNNSAVQTVDSKNDFSRSEFKSLDEVTFGGRILRPTSGVLDGPALVLTTPSGDLEVVDFEYDSFRLPDGNQLSDFSFRSLPGLHSSGLVAAVSSGERIDKLTFSRTLGIGRPVEIQKVELENVSIGSYETSRDGSGQTTENFTVIVHGKVTFTNTPILMTGEAGSSLRTVFNVETGRAEEGSTGFPSTGQLHDNEPAVLKIGSMELPISSFNWGTSEIDAGGIGVSRPVNQQSESISVTFPFDEAGAVALLNQSLTRDDRGPLIEKVEIIRRLGFSIADEPAIADFFILTGLGANVDSFDFDSDGENRGTVRVSFSLEQVSLQLREPDPSTDPNAPLSFTKGNRADWNFEAQTTDVVGVDDAFPNGDATNYPISKNDLDQRLLGLSRISGASNLLLEVSESGVRKGGMEILALNFETRELVSGQQGRASITTEIGLGDIRLLERLAFGRSDDDDFLIRSFNGAGVHQWNLENVRVTSYEIGTQSIDEPTTATIQLAFDEAVVTQQSRDFEGTLQGPLETRIDYLRPAISGSTQFGIRSIGQPQTGLFIDLGSEYLPIEQTQWAVSAAGTEIDQDEFVFSTSELSPGLRLLAADGRVIPEITLKRVEAIGSEQPIEVFEEVVWVLENVRVTSYATVVGPGVGGFGQRAEFSLSFDSVRLTQSIIEPEGPADPDDPEDSGDGFKVSELPEFAFDFVDDRGIRDVPFMTSATIPSDTGTITIDVRGFVDDDDDQVGQAIEDAAPNNGDGNNDGTPDRVQDNVTSLPHPIAGNFVTLVAPAGQRFANVSIVADPAPETSPPADLDFRVGLADYQLTNVPVGEATTVTLLVDGVSGFNTFYKFGPTPRNPTPHYYRFMFDGRTGAQFDGDRIIIHLVDGERGDDDLTANGVIVDPGAPVINNSEFPHHNPVDRFDVNGDGLITAVDALVVINRLNAVGGGAALPVPIPDINDAAPFFDVNPDNNVLPTDALQVINELIRTGGSGEPIVELNAELVESSTGIIDATTRAVAQPVKQQRTSNDELAADEFESRLHPNDPGKAPAFSASHNDEISNSSGFPSEPMATPDVSEPLADLTDDYFNELGHDTGRLF